MNGSEEYERTWQPPPPLPPEPVLEVLPLEEVISLEEVTPLSRIVGADEVTHLEEVPYIEAVPVATLLEEPEFVLPAERPMAVRARGGRGFTILAWFMIVALVGFIFFLNHIWPAIEGLLDGSETTQVGKRNPLRDKPSGVPVDFEKEEPAHEEDADVDMESVVFLVQGRYIVGWNHLLKNAGFYEQIRSLNNGPPSRRLRFVALAGELAGPAEALAQLDQLEREASLTATEKRVAANLRRMYRDFQQRRYQAPSLTPPDRELVKQQLGWFGQLALTPEDSPDRAARSTVISPARLTAILTVTIVIVVIVSMVVGLILLVIFLACLFGGYLRLCFGGFGPYGGIYAETFALWMLAFVGLNFLMELLGSYGVFAGVQRSKIFISGLLDLGTAAIVFWPLIRGVPWREVRHDLGLHWGRKPLREPFVGVGCYVMSLSLLAMGAFVTMIIVLILMLFGQWPDGSATLLSAAADTKPHPAFVEAAKGDWWIRAQVVFLAVIVAPILEEIVFRGVFYRHLRDLSGRFGFAMSVILSAAVSSLIFASIHPQDVLAFPVLMGLATGFALTREWRGSLVPCMVMHAIHNGLISVLFLTMMSMYETSGMF